MKKDPAKSTAFLLAYYGFEPNHKPLPVVINQWLSTYPKKWVIAAVVEAVYQGRYKVNSVDRILDSWSSRGQPIPHFDRDFADFFCGKIIKKMIHREAAETEVRAAQDSELRLVETLDESQNQQLRVISYPAHYRLPNPGIEKLAKLVTPLRNAG